MELVNHLGNTNSSTENYRLVKRFFKINNKHNNVDNNINSLMDICILYWSSCMQTALEIYSTHTMSRSWMLHVWCILGWIILEKKDFKQKKRSFHSTNCLKPSFEVGQPTIGSVRVRAFFYNNAPECCST